MSERKRQRVVIVGAGFGGLAAARALRGSALEVVLVDRSNYHTFLPLLYQVAAAELEPEEIAYPIRSVLRKMPFASFVMKELTGIDLTACTVKTTDQSIPYEFLILATGSMSSFFGVPGAAQCAFELKTLDQRLGETVEFPESGNSRRCGKGVVWQTLGQLTWAFLYGIPSS